VSSERRSPGSDTRAACMQSPNEIRRYAICESALRGQFICAGRCRSRDRQTILTFCSGDQHAAVDRRQHEPSALALALAGEGTAIGGGVPAPSCRPVSGHESP
jgi:hypothetical protein